MKLKSLFVIFIFLAAISTQSQTFQDKPNGDNEGDFPSKWALINGSAEVQTFQGEKAIYLTDKAIITPLLNSKNYLSDEFALEFEAGKALNLTIINSKIVGFKDGKELLKVE